MRSWHPVQAALKFLSEIGRQIRRREKLSAAPRPAGQRLALDWAPGVSGVSPLAASALSHADRAATYVQEQIGGACPDGNKEVSRCRSHNINTAECWE